MTILFISMIYNKTMISPEVIALVKQGLSQGISQDTLVSQMRQSGWNEEDIQEVFAQVTSNIPMQDTFTSQVRESAVYKRKNLMTVFIITHLALMIISFLVSPTLQNFSRRLFPESDAVPCVVGYYDAIRHACTDQNGIVVKYLEHDYYMGNILNSIQVSNERNRSIMDLLLFVSTMNLFLIGMVFRNKKYISKKHYWISFCLFFITALPYVLVYISGLFSVG